MISKIAGLDDLVLSPISRGGTVVLSWISRMYLGDVDHRHRSPILRWWKRKELRIFEALSALLEPVPGRYWFAPQRCPLSSRQAKYTIESDLPNKEKRRANDE
jgi:hypothetical protein